MEKENVLVVVGPTASGKTGLSLGLVKKFNSEIISADSMQIYKKLNIGTAKATLEEQNIAKHHLIDICDIDEEFSVAKYKRMCYEALDDIISREKVPIIVGGTGLYINAVVNNMNFEESKNEEEYSKKSLKIREELECALREKGIDYLYHMLLKLDAKAANNIHKNNTKRIFRAIELAKMSKSKSDIEKRNDLWNRNSSKYNFIVIYIDMPREKLYDRINKRVDMMKDMGIIEEAKMLKNMNLDSKNTAMQAIGYKEFFDYLDGKEDINSALEKLKQGSRRYAKRQVTWFKKLGYDILYNENKSFDELTKEIERKMC